MRPPSQRFLLLLSYSVLIAYKSLFSVVVFLFVFLHQIYVTPLIVQFIGFGPVTCIVVPTLITQNMVFLFAFFFFFSVLC